MPRGRGLGRAGGRGWGSARCRAGEVAAVQPRSLACPRSLPRAWQRGELTERRLEVHEQLLALRHWLDAVEKRLPTLPEPGPALQVTGLLLGAWQPAELLRARQDPAHVSTEAGEVLAPIREDGAWPWPAGRPFGTAPQTCW